MKKASKIVMIVFIIMQIILISSSVLALESPSKYSGASFTGTSGIETIGQQIISIVSTIGSVVSVIILVVLGIKYMMGSAEEKAEYKKTLMPYVIGAAFVFAASSIAGIVFSFSQNLGK